MASTAPGRAFAALGRCQITPKMVKDMAAQLGVRPHPDLYWYCMLATELLPVVHKSKRASNKLVLEGVKLPYDLCRFALRYSLAPEWEAACSLPYWEQ